MKYISIALRICASIEASVELFERRDGRGVERGAVNIEMRAVARTVPAALQRIPMHVAAQMRARGGAFVQLAVLIAIGSDLVQAIAHDCALAALELVVG